MPGRSSPDRSRLYRYDEFPSDYSFAGCAPHCPPPLHQPERILQHKEMAVQSKRATVSDVLTAYLPQGGNPNEWRSQTVQLTSLVFF